MRSCVNLRYVCNEQWIARYFFFFALFVIIIICSYWTLQYRTSIYYYIGSVPNVCDCHIRYYYTYTLWTIGSICVHWSIALFLIQYLKWSLLATNEPIVRMGGRGGQRENDDISWRERRGDALGNLDLSIAHRQIQMILITCNYMYSNARIHTHIHTWSILRIRTAFVASIAITGTNNLRFA